MGARRSLRDADVDSHSFAKSANEWGTRMPRAQNASQPRRTARPGDSSLASCLALLPGHGVERGCFLFHVLAAALGAFRVYFVFFQSENQFEGFVTIVADVVIHGHGGLPLDCDYELRFELYAYTGRLCGRESRHLKTVEGSHAASLHGVRGELPDAWVRGSVAEGSLRLRSGQALRLRGCFASRNGHFAQGDKAAES